MVIFLNAIHVQPCFFRECLHRSGMGPGLKSKAAAMSSDAVHPDPAVSGRGSIPVFSVSST